MLTVPGSGTPVTSPPPPADPPLSRSVAIGPKGKVGALP
jgi:hypothetical protein